MGEADAVAVSQQEGPWWHSTQPILKASREQRKEKEHVRFTKLT